MISNYKDKRDIKTNELRQLLSQTSTWINGDDLFTKLTIQERKKIKMKTKERRKLLTNMKEHF